MLMPYHMLHGFPTVQYTPIITHRDATFGYASCCNQVGGGLALAGSTNATVLNCAFDVKSNHFLVRLMLTCV